MEWFENDGIISVDETIAKFAENEITGKIVNLDSLQKPDFPLQTIDRLAQLGFLWDPITESASGITVNNIMPVAILSKLSEASAGFAAIVASHYTGIKSILSCSNGRGIIDMIYKDNTRPGETLPLVGIAFQDCVDRITDIPNNEYAYLSIPSPEKTNKTVLFCGSGDSTRMLIVESKHLSGYIVGITNLSGCEEMPCARIRLSESDIGKLMVIASGEDARTAQDIMHSFMKLYYSAIMQGTARSATFKALKYTNERFQTGRMIIHHQNVRKKIIDMEIKNQALASFLYRVAGIADKYNVSPSFHNLCEMLITFASSESEYVCNEAVQNHGGYGYMKEYGVEKKLRDIKTLQSLLAPCRLVGLPDYRGYD